MYVSSWRRYCVCGSGSLRERAIEVLGQLHEGKLSKFKLTKDLKDHIRKRLSRLCTLQSVMHICSNGTGTKVERSNLVSDIGAPTFVLCRCLWAVRLSTGVSSVTLGIDTMVPQPKFYELYDVGTGPLYGSTLSSAGTAAVFLAACQDVSHILRAIFRVLNDRICTCRRCLGRSRW